MFVGSSRALVQRSADVDEVVGDHAEPDPALHAGLAPVAAAREAVPALDDADASFAAGAPFLAVAEPAFLLLASALLALGRAIGDADALDAPGFGGSLVPGGVERGVRSNQVGRAPEFALVLVDGGDQQVRIVGSAA